MGGAARDPGTSPGLPGAPPQPPEPGDPSRGDADPPPYPGLPGALPGPRSPGRLQTRRPPPPPPRPPAQSQAAEVRPVRGPPGGGPHPTHKGRRANSSRRSSLPAAAAPRPEPGATPGAAATSSPRGSLTAPTAHLQLPRPFSPGVEEAASPGSVPRSASEPRSSQNPPGPPRSDRARPRTQTHAPRAARTRLRERLRPAPPRPAPPRPWRGQARGAPPLEDRGPRTGRPRGPRVCGVHGQKDCVQVRRPEELEGGRAGGRGTL
ncbi:basic proline-rich protein-like [Vulpes lagopus]|uniref:basic proline-rich protein-like n=1 Tax=Vulpes lagopus TaxID=494514 RepID=UPI001BC922E9|nr:basic proline-rich protein-like [Vulpes lagopus]